MKDLATSIRGRSGRKIRDQDIHTCMKLSQNKFLKYSKGIDLILYLLTVMKYESRWKSSQSCPTEDFICLCFGFMVNSVYCGIWLHHLNSQGLCLSILQRCDRQDDL